MHLLKIPLERNFNYSAVKNRAKQVVDASKASAAGFGVTMNFPHCIIKYPEIFTLHCESSLGKSLGCPSLFLEFR